MVFQKPTPFPMSIYDNIAFGVRLFENLPRSRMDERVEWALTKAALWKEVKDKLHQSGDSLSGGQQQRLCIARAHRRAAPRSCCSTSRARALDPISTAKIEELISELKDDYTVVIVTHNMQQAARVSDFTAYMYLGELIEFGETDQLFVKPTQAGDRGLHHRPLRLTVTRASPFRHAAVMRVRLESRYRTTPGGAMEARSQRGMAPRLEARIARDGALVRQAQELRYRVFAQELGARLATAGARIDADDFDPHCDHLVVRDAAAGLVVGTYRILAPEAARRAGGYCAEALFDFSQLDVLRERMVEVGRACVHPDYRCGATMLLLWSSLARYLVDNGHDYVVGSASIPLADGGHAAASIYRAGEG